MAQVKCRVLILFFYPSCFNKDTSRLWFQILLTHEQRNVWYGNWQAYQMSARIRNWRCMKKVSYIPHRSVLEMDLGILVSPCMCATSFKFRNEEWKEQFGAECLIERAHKAAISTNVALEVEKQQLDITNCAYEPFSGLRSRTGLGSRHKTMLTCSFKTLFELYSRVDLYRLSVFNMRFILVIVHEDTTVSHSEWNFSL